MGEQLQRTKERKSEEAQEETVRKTGGATVEHARHVADEADTLTEEIDALLDENPDSSAVDGLLDEIEELLEPNAQEFVEGFVQKGGE